MALACTASIPTPWWPCCHAALRGGGKWRETDKPCSGWGERSPVPPRYGESLVGGARPSRLRAGPANMAAPGLGLVDPHRPGVQLPACPTGPRGTLMGACGSQPHSLGLGVPGSAPAPICPQAAQGRRQARSCPQGIWGHHRAGGGRGGLEPDPTAAPMGARWPRCPFTSCPEAAGCLV